MAVGIYTLPICDGCKLPWLPVGWKQDSDPRNPDKSLRCGKCKATGWDREFVKQQKAEATETEVNPFDPTKTIEMPRNVALNEALEKEGNVAQTVEQRGAIVTTAAGSTPAISTKSRCKHRMTDCPICHPKEAA